ncbi:DUF808 domain-containing protein [Leeia oryzae]|uniref:DUF808 domain-containing protein n=1 Tax=Leeia oryzae TaxID=356662 RepID=UPI00036F7671|nr:DUF808 domain-containing protein [Leeia oryzae]
MAGSSFFALIDDIATLLDDIAVMSKTAAQKTAGVLGDDLALNAQQVTGIEPERELPVVWAVAKGSLKNKAILVPAALLISALIPWAVMPLLMIGGAYLCFEGVEKLAHKWLHSPAEDEAHHQALLEAVSTDSTDMVAFEKEKIDGAVRTDFILSAEIIVIALGTISHAPLLQQVMVLVAVAIAMTIGVYGFVAGIVKLDDAGLYLCRQSATSHVGRIRHVIGRLLLATAPKMMKVLSVGGTIAMFLVGGGIVTHGIPAWHDYVSHPLGSAPAFFAATLPSVANILAGMVTGAVILLIVYSVQKLVKRV